jgi:hypothetical protein
MRLHKFILVLLIRFWPKLFDRYYWEYNEVQMENYRRLTKKRGCNGR